MLEAKLCLHKPIQHDEIGIDERVLKARLDKAGGRRCGGALMALLPAAMLAAFASPAFACGPTDDWYFDNTTVVFEGRASCDVAKRSCRVRVLRVVKAPSNVDIHRRTIEVDYQDWYADNPLPEDLLSIRCGHPLFEPEEREFRARFYGDIDPRSGELIVRTYRLVQPWDE